MKVEFGERKLISSLNIDAKIGHFALDVTPFAFENCRERFAKAFTETTPGFFMKHESGRSADVAALLLKVESLIRVPDCSKFAETNRDSIIWIEPSDFWKCCPVRRSLLTIIVRCGILYSTERDNFEEAIFGHEYVIPTKRAVMRFLFGFTKYVGPPLEDTASTIQTQGWKKVFEGLGEEDVKKMLIKPEMGHFTPSVELTGGLWF